MTIEEFRNTLIEEINERIDGEYELTVNDVIKNNGVKLHGICFKMKGRNISPTVYADGYYDKFKAGETLESLAERVISNARSAEIKDDIDAEFYTDFEKVKSKLYVRLVNTERNEELLSQIPSRKFLDLSMVVYCDVSDMCRMDATILVRNEHMDRWKADADELIDIAYENTKNIGCTISDMTDLIPAKELEGVMFVMSNIKSLYGAVCLTFDDKLDELCERHEGGVYIIPSSIHEVILIPERMMTREEVCLNEMINSVNRECLDEGEILSDHAYYYSPFEGYLSV